MNVAPKDYETEIVGSWNDNGAAVAADDACRRIDWLTSTYFETVSVDGDNWEAVYRDPADGRHWKLTYPNSHMHGGGPPMLRVLGGPHPQSAN